METLESMRSRWYTDKNCHSSFGDYMAELAIKQKVEIERLETENNRQSGVITELNEAIAKLTVEISRQADVITSMNAEVVALRGVAVPVDGAAA